MTDLRQIIRASVQAILPYSMSEPAYQIKLNQNENPFDLPPALKQEILTAFARMQWNRYPAFTTHQLREKIADRENVTPEMILVGNGSNELLQNIGSIILSPGQKLLTVLPTFQLYEQMGCILGAELIQLPLKPDFTFPVNEILTRLQTDQISLQIYASPNNPTGTILTPAEMQSILAAATGVVVCDEAYYDFYGKTARDYLAQTPHLVVTRTFSKAFGMAGLRIGYLIAQPELVTEIYKAKLPYNLNLFSELAALTILKYPDLIQARIQMILAQREWLLTALRSLAKISVVPTHANFFLIQTPLAADQLFQLLLAAGILVRNVSHNHPLLRSYLRIAVGTPAENQQLIRVLEKILK